jgi:hypothetical protein
MTYALDDSRKTVLRASYARYVSQIASSDGSYDNPAASSYLQYYWDDSNSDKVPQANEVLTGAGVYYAYNIDPENPASLTSPNIVDSNYKAPTDDEFIVGIDRELAPNFAISAAYTYRSARDLVWYPRNGITRADYTNSSTTTRDTVLGTFSGTIYGAVGGLPGRTQTNRPDYNRRFQGAEVSLIKRLANKWMGRVAFSYNDWAEQFNGGLTDTNVYDPTRTQSITALAGLGPLVEGGDVSILSGGSGKQQLFTSVRWQLSGNALVQLPWDVELAGAVFGRQGHPRPTFLTLTAAGEPRKQVLANEELNIDDRRYPDLWNVDVRLAKNIRLGGASAVLSAEVFNVFNSGVELTRTRDATSAAFNRLDEILSPRIVRFGLRFLF